jgi:hypothetical protein
MNSLLNNETGVLGLTANGSANFESELLVIALAFYSRVPGSNLKPETGYPD